MLRFPAVRPQLSEELELSVLRETWVRFVRDGPQSGLWFEGCARTEEEAAELRESSELLLVTASAQVLAATATLLVPVLPLALVAFMVGSYTAGRAADLVWMLLAYHRRVHGVAAFNYLVFYALRC
ncbi:hypothetical protein HU200_046847 [Digitaria exilis]|uniref:Uncharacterized protein n=1 Tax=Digitaria exilis TaxID=1010633 RepID=A0A835AXQ1_9POAL|nr:hypothetical protein HU200_046847 [Digitaria exilis]